MKKLTAVFIFILFVFIAKAQDEKKVVAGNFSVKIPADWGIYKLPGHALLVAEPPGEEMTVQTNFDVEIEKTRKKLAAYCDRYQHEMDTNRLFTEFEVKSRNEIDFKGFRAIEFHCTASVGYLPMEWRSVFFKKGRKIYKLTTTSLIGMFIINREITNKIFESFTFE